MDRRYRDKGFTLRWRKRWDKGYHKDLLMWVLMDYFIDFANYKKSERYIKGYGVIEINRGEHIFGTKIMSEYFGVTRQKIRSAVSNLEKIGFLTTRTTNRFTIAKVINYDTYQPNKSDSNQQNNQPITSQQPAGNHQNNQPITTPNKDKEYKERKEREISNQNPQIIIEKTISYLNKKAGVDFNPEVYITKSLILDRINDGAKLDDFKLVIKKKCSQWLNDPKMSGNLRPVTLFAADKFEGYLQEAKRNGGDQKTKPKKLQDIELLNLGYDIITKFGEDKFNDFCIMNNLKQNDIEAIRSRAANLQVK